MKVLLVHNAYRIRGGEDVTFDREADALDRAGIQVQKLLLSNDDLDDSRPVRNAVATVWNGEAADRIRATVTAFRPDVVHFHNTFPQISLAGIAAAYGAGAATVRTVHNYRFTCAGGTLLRDGKPCERCVGKFASWDGLRFRCYRGSRAASAALVAMQVSDRLRRAPAHHDLLIAVSDFVRQKLITSGWPEAGIRVKPHFADAAEIGPGGDDRFVYAGRLSEEKGVLPLLDAWAQMPEPPKLDLFGDGPLRDEVERRAKTLSSVKVHGPVSRQHLTRALQTAVAAVIPSVCHETFGLVAVEAMAVGTPVVATRMGGLPEVVEEGVTGYLIPADDAEALRQAVQRIRASGDAMRSAARAAYESRYTEKAHLEAIQAIYDEAISRSAQRRRKSRARTDAGTSVQTR